MRALWDGFSVPWRKGGEVALFIIRHQHDAEHCPATDPYVGATLLNYLSRPSLRQHGIEIQGEAIVQGEHTLYMIVECENEGRARTFMAPFAAAGSVDVYPASTCAGVVASGGCAAPTLAFDDAAPTVDAERACQLAIEAGLIVHRAHPLNAETSIPALIGGVVMPNAQFYVRNHFSIPRLDPMAWRLDISGLVEHSLSLTLRDLTNMPSQTQVVTLECAGNGRAFLDPRVDGDQWVLGAVSTAEWTGVPLTEVLDRAGITTGAREVVFRGADGGALPERPGRTRFERSLSIADACDGTVMLAYAMNGESLPTHHGFPLRVVVPDWYAVASVKWLTEIEVIAEAFSGQYQTESYIYEEEHDGVPVQEPVTLMRVRSLITEPAPDEAVTLGEVAIRGVAWSGAAPIARVQVSVGDGPWQAAKLRGQRSRHRWQWWELMTRIDQPGEVTIRARADDLAGHTQPLVQAWNRLGYGNNAVHTVVVRAQ
jgi:DMSO/TMAO reductase YedYZ molybdopterin-dependent catalytic subunit